MTIPARMLGILLAALLSLAGTAHAHTKSESHMDWRITGRVVHLVMTVPEIEARRLAGPGEASPRNEAVSRYLAPRISVAASGRSCPAQTPPAALASNTGFRRFEWAFDCPSGDRIVLHSAAFFDLVPSHVTLAQVTTGTGPVVEQIFTSGHQDFDLAEATSGNELENASFIDYIRLGVLHIFTGIDHQSFLLGLILVSRRLRDLVFVITGFTLGHSVTLALAVTGIIRPHAEYIDALIGLTIALIGAENVAVASRRPEVVAVATVLSLSVFALIDAVEGIGLPWALLLGAGLFASNYLVLSHRLGHGGGLRLVVTLVFGLIHGFGFASDLLDMNLPANRLAELLVGFNLGVEIGQLALVAVVLVVAAAFVRLRLAPPRALVTEFASAGLVGFGFYLLTVRGYS